MNDNLAQTARGMTPNPRRTSLGQIGSVPIAKLESSTILAADTILEGLVQGLKCEVSSYNSAQGNLLLNRAHK